MSATLSSASVEPNQQHYQLRDQRPQDDWDLCRTGERALTNVSDPRLEAVAVSSSLAARRSKAQSGLRWGALPFNPNS